jgi:hypothetical protein
LSLHPEPDEGARPDSDRADLVSAVMSPRLLAPLPVATDEHLPATALDHGLFFWHAASYPTRIRLGKAAHIH